MTLAPYSRGLRGVNEQVQRSCALLYASALHGELITRRFMQNSASLPQSVRAYMGMPVSLVMHPVWLDGNGAMRPPKYIAFGSMLKPEDFHQGEEKKVGNSTCLSHKELEALMGVSVSSADAMHCRSINATILHDIGMHALARYVLEESDAGHVPPWPPDIMQPHGHQI
jgi:hypothetical protein